MTPNAIPTILGIVLFAGINAYGYYLFREKDQTASETMGAILTLQNSNKPVALTVAERDEVYRQCAVAFRTQKDPGIEHIGKPEDVESMLARFSKESCGCVIRQLEKNTTTFEFVLGMSMQFAFAPRDDYARFSSGDPKKREQILPFAQSVGLTTKQFDAAGEKAAAAVSKAGKSCMESDG